MGRGRLAGGLAPLTNQHWNDGMMNMFGKNPVQHHLGSDDTDDRTCSRPAEGKEAACRILHFRTLRGPREGEGIRKPDSGRLVSQEQQCVLNFVIPHESLENVPWFADFLSW